LSGTQTGHGKGEGGGKKHSEAESSTGLATYNPKLVGTGGGEGEHLILRTRRLRRVTEKAWNRVKTKSAGGQFL